MCFGLFERKTLYSLFQKSSRPISIDADSTSLWENHQNLLLTEKHGADSVNSLFLLF